MGPSFLPRLVNGPFEDPALFVPFRYQKRALLFDLGDVTSLSGRDILKVTHIFVTHTHMDHFSGFDRVLRILLGRDKDLVLYGPQGFLANVSGKLAGYNWNLVANYTNRFTLHVVELHPHRALCRRFCCHRGFAATDPIREKPFSGIVLDENALTVRAVHLDHGIPVLAFALAERFHVNIIPDALARLNLASGPWLNRFKALLYDHADPATMLELPGPHQDEPARQLPLKQLTDAIARISPGQRIAYIADAAGTPANLAKLAALVDGVDHLFVEAAFSHRHRDLAQRKHHLTARQAGTLARAGRAKQLTLFHFSPRYADCPEMLIKEAEDAYSGR